MNNEDIFWHTICRSIEWKLWYKEIMRRHSTGKVVGDRYITDKPVFDIDESQETGYISDKHFAEFVEFIKTLPKRNRK